MFNCLTTQEVTTGTLLPGKKELRYMERKQVALWAGSGEGGEQGDNGRGG